MAPDVPSVLELGHKKRVAENFLGVSGPAGLPREVVGRLHGARKKSLADRKVAQRKEWHKPVKDSGAKLN